MKLRTLIRCSVIVSAALLAACGGNTPPAASPSIGTPASAPTAISASPQQQPTATTISAEPTGVPSPTKAPMPTAVSAPSVKTLDSQAPLLIYPVANGLMAAQADGTSKALTSNSIPTLTRNLSEGLSSHGGLLAFRSGDNPLTPDQEGIEPLTLKLLDVRTGTTNPITRFFSADMEQAIKTAAATSDRTAAVEAGIAVIENDHTLAWSPDGRYLAFIAAIDGPSSDLYSYYRETGQISRLTDGPNQAANVFWSPDSQWIIHEEVENFGTGAGWNVKAVWAAAPDDSGNRKLYDAAESSGGENFVAWVSPKTFLVYSWTVMGLQNIRLVDLDTGAAQLIGPQFPVQSFAFDPESQTQLYVTDDYAAQQNNLQGGLYLTAPTKQPQFIAPGNWYDVRWLPHAKLFFAKGQDGVLSVASDGTTTNYKSESALPLAAPDGAWLAAWGDGNFTSPIGLRLYTPDGELKRQITSDAVSFATWSPDSAGAFYVSDGRLYYAAIPNGEPQSIEEGITSTEPGSMGWAMP